MDLLEDLKMSLLNHFNFAMIYMIHKMSVSIKNNLNYLKKRTFECFFNEYTRLLIFLQKLFFFITYTNGKLKS